MSSSKSVFDPVAMLQDLVRIDTSNPPGTELPAIEYLAAILEDADIPYQVVAKDPHRPNLIARIAGSGEAPGLLMHGHVDVVPTATQAWSRDPFGADIVDGYLWGRGSLDMKSGLVMMLGALLRLAESGKLPRGDVVFCALSDEEAGSDYGARFLVEENPELFDGLRYAIGEFGGFPLRLAGVKFYPIQVAERVRVTFRLVVKGEPGHSSLGVPGGVTARLGRLLRDLDRKRCPVHVVPTTRLMLESMVDYVSGPQRWILRSLLSDRLGPPTLAALRSQLGVLEPVLRNTVTATMIHSGHKINVVPDQAEVMLDGRMLPGLTVESFAEEVRRIVGDDIDLHYDAEQPSAQPPDLSLFPTLADILKRRDPDAVPVPFLLPAMTDGRWFARLRIQHYGFVPMTLPDDFAFQATIHGADERIPVDSLPFGVDAIYDLISRL